MDILQSGAREMARTNKRITMEIPDTRPMRGTTKEFAKLQHVKPQTVLKRLCTTGSYFGREPIKKMSNGRWEWELSPAAERAR